MAAEFCKKTSGKCSFCSQCAAGSFGNTVVDVTRLAEYRKRPNLKVCDDIIEMIQTGLAHGLIFIVDRGADAPLIGASGSYQRNPSIGLGEARKLVSTLTMMADANAVRAS